MADHEIQMKVRFSESHPASETRQNIASDDTLPTIAHKLHKWYNDIPFKDSDLLSDTNIEINASSAIPFNSVDVNLTKAISGLAGRRIISTRVYKCNIDAYVKHIAFDKIIGPTSVTVQIETNGPIAANTVVLGLNIVTMKV